jgi:hypothetical protein
MPEYMLLLYAEEATPEERKERDAQMPAWIEFTEGLREAGLFVSSGQLRPVDTATTVRVRDGETEILDGPFAVTKEYLGGYYMVKCADLDEALKIAAQLPIARYGSVEVRPLVELPALFRPEGQADAVS